MVQIRGGWTCWQWRRWPGGSALVVRGSASRAITLVVFELVLYFRIVDLREKMVLRQHAPDRHRHPDRHRPRQRPRRRRGRQAARRHQHHRCRGNTVSAGSTLTIAGIFDLGNKGANQRTTYVALHTAQSLLGLPGGVTSLEVTVRDVYAAELIAERITADTGVEADSWIKTSAQFFTASAQATANTAIRFFVGLSVAFGIASVLAVTGAQKREIGILRAMGISQGQILRVFLLQGGLLGLAGRWSEPSASALLLWRPANAPTPRHALLPVLRPWLFSAALLLAPASPARRRSSTALRRVLVLVVVIVADAGQAPVGQRGRRELRGARKADNPDADRDLGYGIDLTLRKGEFVAATVLLVSGKSTLLNIVGSGLDRPGAGTLSVCGEEDDDDLTTGR